MILLAVLVLTAGGCFGRLQSTSGTALLGTVTTLPEAGGEARPLAGIQVVAAGQTTTTDQAGQFRLTGLAPGTLQLQLSKGLSYPGQTFSAPVTAGSTVRQTFALANLHQLSKDQPAAPSGVAAALRQHDSEGHPTGYCSACHEVENPVGPMFLKANAATLCSNTECHVTPAFAHPAAHFDAAAHPALRPDGRLAAYDNLSCLRCHRPHRDSATWVADGLLASPDLATNTCGGCHPSASLPGTHPVVGATPCATCHDRAGNVTGHSSCAGYSGRYGTPCHRSSSTLAMGPHADPTKLPNGCRSCHNTQGTPYPKLLVAANDENLCFRCHSAAGSAARGTATWPGQAYYQNTKYQAPWGAKSAPSVHWRPPANTAVPTSYPGSDSARGTCTNCHDPHGVRDAGGALVPNLLRQSMPGLCTACHANVNLNNGFAGTLSGSDSRHSVDVSGTSVTCASCHNPHAVTAKGVLAGTNAIATDPQATNHEKAADAAAARYFHEYNWGYNTTIVCLQCHYGYWAGAPNVWSEISSFTARTTSFVGPPPASRYFQSYPPTTLINYHKLHTNPRHAPFGCASCHETHASAGSGGSTPRRGLLKPWIVVNGYRNGKYADAKASCQTPAGSGCHGEGRDDTQRARCATCHSFYTL